MAEIIKKLFTEWELDTWANVLEVVGFIFSIISLFIVFLLKSEITKLKISYIFDKTISEHLNKLTVSTTKFNVYFKDYNSNIENIEIELTECISELEDLKKKLAFSDSLKSTFLVYFIKRRLTKPFEEKIKIEPTIKGHILKYYNRLYKTTSHDVWIIYRKIHGIIRQVENIKNNKDKSL